VGPLFLFLSLYLVAVVVWPTAVCERHRRDVFGISMFSLKSTAQVTLVMRSGMKKVAEWVDTARAMNTAKATLTRKDL
jgi:hypothetical protein